MPCPVVRDRGPDWVLTTELPGRDLARPWPEGKRLAALAAMAEGLRMLHALDPAARLVIEAAGGDPGDPRIDAYIRIDQSG